MRRGIAFPHTHPHEAVHLRPLMRRLEDLTVLPSDAPAVAVHATTQAPLRGAVNVQVFHGLGDKGYVLNPLFLQRLRFPRVRTALNMAAKTVRLRANFLRPPRRPAARRGRYGIVNAYGPRFRDHLEAMLRGTEVVTFGHVALNDRGDLYPKARGPIVWLPTWDNSRYLGGVSQSGLAPFAREVARVARDVPVRVKYHPLTVAHGQDARARALLEGSPGVTVLDAATDAYDALRGARAVLTDTSSLGFEAYCLGYPVAIARPAAVRPAGLHAELEERVPVLSVARPDLQSWAGHPEAPGDRAWAEDLMHRPDPRRNDAFAGLLRDRASRKRAA